MMRNGDIPLLHLKGAYRVEVHLQMGMERNSLSCLASRAISFMSGKHLFRQQLTPFGTRQMINHGCLKIYFGDERGNCPKEPKKSVLDKTCGCYMYRATDEISGDAKWHPSIHMPKEAARIWLKVTDVRVERLQEIDEDGVWDEGFRFKPPCLTRVSADGHTCDLDGPCTSSIKYCDMTMGELFGRELWNSTIKKSDIDRYGWDANPWVWVIEFEPCEKLEGV